jgi:hypothetical protein
MCDVCDADGVNWRFKVGKHKTLAKARLYNVYDSRTAVVTLCVIHDIELFTLGEKKFISKHPKLALKLAQEKQKYAG